jgi:hypothetical protein
VQGTSFNYTFTGKNVELLILKVHYLFLFLASIPYKCFADTECIRGAIATTPKNIASSNQVDKSRIRVMSNASTMTHNKANRAPRIVIIPPNNAHFLISFFISTRFLKKFSGINITSFFT